MTPGAAGLKAIALTAYVRPEDEARALREGFDRHIGKPVDAGDLEAAILALKVKVEA